MNRCAWRPETLERGLGLTLLASLLLALAVPALGQGLDTRTLVPVPYNATRPVEVTVTTDRTSLTIGEVVTICFRASRPGYVTLWNVSAGGDVARIFPNAFTPATAGATHVPDGRPRCAGKDGDPFRFRVDGPAGIDDLYLLWTDDASLQPQPAAYPDARRFAEGLARLDQAGSTRWATAKTSFDINEPGRPRPAQAPPPRPAPAVQTPPRPDAPKVLVLAMGANVRPLTKPNQDALMFAAAMRRQYNLPEADVRVLENVHKPQFKEGMDWLRQRARPQDVVVVYFSGHGTQAPDPSAPDGLAEAFVPYEFEANGKPTARDLIWSWEFVSWVNALPTASVVTVVDACHSAGLYRSMEATVVGAKEKFFVLPADMTFDDVRAPGTRALSAVANAKGTLLAAARRDQSALEIAQGSLFTLVLVDVVAKGQGGTLTESFTAAAQEVDRATKNRQSPTLVGSRAAADRLLIGNRAARP